MTAKTPPAELFTLPQAARIARVDAQLVPYWIKTGMVVPDQRATGRGVGRGHLFGFRGLVTLRTIQRLREQDISLQAVRRVAAYLQRTRGWEDPLARARLVVVGSDVMHVEAGRVESALRRPGEPAFAFVLDLEGVVGEVRRAVEVMRKAA